MRPRTLTALLLVLAACTAVGCGADEETKPSIPVTSADALLTQLGSVEDRFNFGDGACNDIPENERTVNDQIAALPSSVDPDVRNALQDSFDHLFELTSEQCDKTEGQDTDTDTDTDTETTDTTNTETTDTNTTPTDTNTTPTDTDTTPTDTEPTDTEPPETPGSGGGGAQGPGL